LPATWGGLRSCNPLVSPFSGVGVCLLSSVLRASNLSKL
jgi:hypothetical protein